MERQDDRDHVVRAVVRRDGLVLLVRRSADDLFPGMWEFPGGGSDGEDHEIAVSRELREEAALDVRQIGELLLREPFEVPGGRCFDEFTYEVQADGDIVLSFEHDMHVWHDPTVLFNDPLSHTAAIVLAQLA